VPLPLTPHFSQRAFLWLQVEVVCRVVICVIHGKRREKSSLTDVRNSEPICPAPWGCHNQREVHFLNWETEVCSDCNTLESGHVFPVVGCGFPKE
jgi:hypothetical protein